MTLEYHLVSIVFTKLFSNQYTFDSLFGSTISLSSTLPDSISAYWLRYHWAWVQIVYFQVSTITEWTLPSSFCEWPLARKLKLSSSIEFLKNSSWRAIMTIPFYSDLNICQQRNAKCSFSLSLLDQYIVAVLWQFHMTPFLLQLHTTCSTLSS